MWMIAFHMNAVYINPYKPMSAPESILQLVDNFEFRRQTYLSQGYNETQVRLEYIDPFFEALGWDVYNKSGTALAYIYRKINALVYELYSLTDEEIKIIEEI